MGVHPIDGPDRATYEMYLMCDDLEKTVADLKKKGVNFPRRIIDAGWGKVTALELPGGLELGLYEPRHPTAIGTGPKPVKRAAKKVVTKKRKVAAKKKPRRR
jgi:hypothetical protein